MSEEQQISDEAIKAKAFALLKEWWGRIWKIAVIVGPALAAIHPFVMTYFVDPHIEEICRRNDSLHIKNMADQMHVAPEKMHLKFGEVYSNISKVNKNLIGVMDSMTPYIDEIKQRRGMIPEGVVRINGERYWCTGKEDANGWELKLLHLDKDTKAWYWRDLQDEKIWIYSPYK